VGTIQGINPVQEKNNMANETNNAILESVKVKTDSKSEGIKNVDSYFTPEQQTVLAAKYAVKYSDADQREHKANWPEFAGNSFTMYVLAETLNEAQKAIFSLNSKLFLGRLRATMAEYTPTTHGAVLTEMMTTYNRAVSLKLMALYEEITLESQRIELLKMYSKELKLASKTGKDTELAKLKFFHAADGLGIVPNTIW
jgi:hypothetical protein